ncbi:MAG: periplasmic heavy metal sensor [Rhizorhabdus sp.]|uniref:Spy/CpxP family protein refolding chaperone n=1 Tax=Rhizorhabdus sp. TaxID=1968843 RepID=UPI001B495650|nr:periplasmic heavy metal sensor [Rhizorhabdus sp.]MBP8231246.1 periplasmic heavy metal sensor [Rhizorhabdus sp.]
MKPGLRNLILTIVLVVLAAGGGAWLCAHYVVSHHTGRPSLHDMVHKNLDLTPEQSRRLDAIEKSYASERKRLEGEIRSANRELAVAIQKGEKDSPELNAAIDHLHMAMGALQKATIAHVFDMRSVLTPEQAKTFDAEIVSALTEEGR